METVLGMSALSVSSTGVDIMYIVYKTTNKITGDYYIDQKTCLLYKKTSTGWGNSIANFRFDCQFG